MLNENTIYIYIIRVYECRFIKLLELRSVIYKCRVGKENYFYDFHQIICMYGVYGSNLYKTVTKRLFRPPLLLQHYTLWDVENQRLIEFRFAYYMRDYLFMVCWRILGMEIVRAFLCQPTCEWWWCN